MKKQTYSEKLKSPKWQRKRLEILERDGWKCSCCGDTETTLNVHHCYYKKDKEPWEYPNKSLIVLCEDCHKEEKENIYKYIKYLHDGLKKLGIISNDMFPLLEFISEWKFTHNKGVVFSMISKIMTNEKFQSEVIDLYFGELSDAKKIS